MASALPYVLVYTKQQGLRSQETGLVFGIMPFLAFLSMPLLAMAADRWRLHKAVLMAATLITGVAHVFLTAVPARPSHDVVSSDVTLMCNPRQPLSVRHCESVDSITGSRGCLGDVGAVKMRNRSLVLDETVCEDSLEMEKPSCVISVAHLLRAMKGNNLRNNKNAVCQVKCVASSKINFIHSFHVCLGNKSLTSSVSDTLSKGCSINTVPFPNTFHLSGLKQNGQDTSVSFINRASVKLNDSTTLHCTDFEVTSLQIHGVQFSSATCRVPQQLHCIIMCTLPLRGSCSTGGDFSLDATFCLILAAYFVGFLAYAPIIPLSDAACYSMLKDRWSQYGRQRVWGTIGYLTMSLLTFLVIYMKGKLDYHLQFYAFGVLMAAASFAVHFVDIPTDLQCGNIFRSLGTLLALPKVLAMLVMGLVFGMMYGSLGFLFWFLEDLEAPPYIFGLMTVLNVTTEIPAFFLVGRVIQRFGSVACLCVGVVLMSLRLLVYSLLRNPWLVMLTEPLHGPAFGLLQASATTYMSWISPPGLSATSQGLFGATKNSLGHGTGVMVAGLMVGAVGPHLMFAVYAAAGLTVSAAFTLLHHCVFTHSVQNGISDQHAAENGGLPIKSEQSQAEVASADVVIPLCNKEEQPMQTEVMMDQTVGHSAGETLHVEMQVPLATHVSGQSH